MSAVVRLAAIAGVAAVLGGPVASAAAHDPRFPGVVAHGDRTWIDRRAETMAAVPSIWCGSRRTLDDTVHEWDNGPYRYHAIYAVPADGVDRFDLVAHTLQADALQASALLEQLYGRAIRFDMGTPCGPDFLDISAIRLARTRATLAQAGDAGATAMLTMISADLAGAGFDPLPMTGSVGPEAAARSKNYLVWIDSPELVPGLCGVGTAVTDTKRDQSNANNYGGKLAVVLAQRDRFCNSNTVRHEIGHNLGALMPGAPHLADGLHCGDAFEDTMCVLSAPRRSGGEFQREYFDYRNDDYWDPPGGALGWWTVNLNRFLCPGPGCNTPPDGSVLGSLTNVLGKLAGSLLSSCSNHDLGLIVVGAPCPGTIAKPDDEVARREVAPARPRLIVNTRRADRGHWRVSLRLRDAERATVTVSCRRRGKKVRVLRRTLRAGKQVRATVRCDGEPTATVAAT